MKNILTILGLALFFVSTLNAGDTPIDIINKYWNIVENAKKINNTYDQKSIEEMKKIIFVSSKQSAETNISNGRYFLITSKQQNDFSYKGKLNMSKNINIITTKTEKNTGKFIVYYNYFAYQDKNYKLPNGEFVAKTPNIMKFKAKKIDGSIKWFIN